MVQRGLSRRDFLRATVVVSAAGAVALTASGAEALPAAPTGTVAARRQAAAALSFTPIAPSSADELIVPDGYSYEILLRWGDPLFPGAPEFDFDNQTGEAQARQFGYNNDFVAFMPLPLPRRRGGRPRSRRGLLWVNHECVNPQIMFRTGTTPRRLASRSTSSCRRSAAPSPTSCATGARGTRSARPAAGTGGSR